MTDISQHIVAWRKGHGLTQAAAAERLGVRQGTLSRIEAGVRSPSLDLAKRMVGVGALPADFLSAESAS